MLDTLRNFQFDLANQSTTQPALLPFPKDRTYIDSPVDERLRRLIARLQQDFTAHKGPPEYLLATDEAHYRQILFKIGLDATNLDAAALYVYGPHILVLGPNVVALLDDHDARARLAGLRIVTHEWFHAMRASPNRVFGLEEGGAELFADRTTRTLTGIGGELRRIQKYTNLVSGVEALGEAARGHGNAYHWMMPSRTEKDIAGWCRREFLALGLEEQDTESLVEYDERSSGSWGSLVQEALRRRRKS
ncbi:hypothetical protein ACI3L1_09365 [Deinococcus sp. SM5_A1]|uniref:hypothetical protein n=1 Tax=Deinococcus sp. SM5_A1 TaxID=3379094 RepID=UPI00385917FA